MNPESPKSSEADWWMWEWSIPYYIRLLTSLQARHAYPKPNPLRSTTLRLDRPVVRSMRSINRNS